MKPRFFVSLLAITGVFATGATVASCPPSPSSIQQAYVTLPGHVQPGRP